MKKKQNESGQSLVEFALVLPILIIMLFGIFDIGRVIFIRTNLQHLTAEIQKISVFHLEKGVEGGIQTGSMFPTLDKAIAHIIDNSSLDKDAFDYKITLSEPQKRHFQRHHYNPYNPEFDVYDNRHDFQYVTVETKYHYKTDYSLTSLFNKDGFILTDRYSGLIYIGSDAYDKK